MRDRATERVHLLLSAGGVRCLTYIGALEELEDKGCEIATVSTCSAGTFVGALYCCGVSPHAMREAVLGLDLRRLAGDVRWPRLRRLRTLMSWPYALYPEPGIPRVFREILAGQGLDSNPRLGDLRVPLSTAAVDVAAKRLLVYSSDGNPDMSVAELLGIATALPLLYAPHIREGREILDASLASYAPIWLATGQAEELPIVVLRAQQGRTAAPKHLPGWMNQVMSGAVASRDTFLLERMPRVNVFEIDTTVSAFDFTADIEGLIKTGRRVVAEQLERQHEGTVLNVPQADDDDRAQGKASELYGVHLDRLARSRTATVFLSYAHEDEQWVKRLRKLLGDLLTDPDVTVWDDSYIKPGSLWDHAVEDAIRRARVAVLFVSKSSVKSTYMTETELPLLRKHVPYGRRLWIPIDDTVPPGEEDAIQTVGNKMPLESMQEPDADRTLSELARRIEEMYRDAAKDP